MFAPDVVSIRWSLTWITRHLCAESVDTNLLCLSVFAVAALLSIDLSLTKIAANGYAKSAGHCNASYHPLSHVIR